MRAVTFSRLGGPEVLEVSDLPEPQPGSGEVRIRVAAATVNPTDISFRSGRQLTVAQLAEMGVRPPFIPGMELAGEVAALGPGADRDGVGRQVDRSNMHPAQRPEPQRWTHPRAPARAPCR